MKSEVLAIARAWVSAGFSVIPILKGSKKPAISWTEFQDRLPRDDELVKWFQDTDHGIGFVMGSVSSGAYAIDFDDAALARYCFDLDKLAKATYVQDTPKGVHVVLRSPEGSPPVKTRNYREWGLDLDVRGEGSYIVGAPSIHPSGKPYVARSSGIPIGRSDFGTFEKRVAEVREEWPIVQEVLPKYVEGRRHDIDLGLAALLQSRGFTEERALRVIRGIARIAGDDETADREQAVRDTYARQPGTNSSLRMGDDLVPSVAAALDSPVADSSPRSIEFETAGTYRHYRTQGLTEPQALEALEREDGLSSSVEETFPMKGETSEGASRIANLLRGFLRSVLKKAGLLEEHPVGWNKEENGALGKAMEFEDVVWRVSQIVEIPREKIVIGNLLSAQGHLAPLLKAIGPAIHGVFKGPKWASGKSHAARAFTLLSGGTWLDAATPAFIKSVRKDGPCILGIDEGDEAEKENPGLKGILLESHNWDAHFGKFSDPDAKGKRGPEAVPFGGPIFITFRAKPWPAVASRAVLFDMERSKDPKVSDNGAVMESFLAPCIVWLRERCIAALHDKNELWAKLRITDSDFLERLDRVSRSGPTLRSRDKARSLLFIADLLGIDLEREIAATIQEEEDESENESIIEAILSDPAVMEGREIPSEELRLNLQKRLKDAREPINLTRNRFAAALAEMGWVKESDMWKRTRYEGRITTVLFPAVYKAAHPERFT